MCLIYFSLATRSGKVSKMAALTLPVKSVFRTGRKYTLQLSDECKSIIVCLWLIC